MPGSTSSPGLLAGDPARRSGTSVPRGSRGFPQGDRGLRREAERLELQRQTALMARFRDTREPQAFEDLYDSARAGLLTWIVQRMATSGLDADPTELLQDTFINVYRYAGTFRDERGNTFRGWARTIAANVVRRARGRRRPALSFQALPNGVFEPTDEREGPHDTLELDEQRRSLARAWVLVLLHYAAAAQELSERDRQALHLVEVEGLPYAEVARRLRVRSSNMKMIVFRSRRRIRARMLQAFGRSSAASGAESAAGRGDARRIA